MILSWHFNIFSQKVDTTGPLECYMECRMLSSCKFWTIYLQDSHNSECILYKNGKLSLSRSSQTVSGFGDCPGGLNVKKLEKGTFNVLILILQKIGGIRIVFKTMSNTKEPNW